MITRFVQVSGKMIMKKCVLLLLSLCILVSLLGCSNRLTEKKEVVVFAAASLTETLNEIKNEYELIHPEVNIIFNFDSSGILMTQIEEGAECDIFFSASPKQINELEEKGLILKNSRQDILENKVCIAVNGNSQKEINDFDHLAEMLKGGEVFMAIGNEDVPDGQYTRKIFEYYNIFEDEIAKEGHLTYGTNVKEVATQIEEELVDCGIIYSTDAYSAGLEIIDTATKDMCGQVIYPLAILKETKDKEAADSFVEYLKSEDAKRIFESVGFVTIN